MSPHSNNALMHRNSLKYNKTKIKLNTPKQLS